MAQRDVQVRSLTYIAGQTQVENTMALLKDKNNAVVSLYGGPGFEKSAIAIEVAQQLSENLEDHTILVIFSDLTTTNSVDEVARTLCSDAGVNYVHNNPKLSLHHWMISVKAKVVFVMDGIDNLLEENNRPDFSDFLNSLAKLGNFQMITTSRSSYQIPNPSFSQIYIEEMDDKECMELLRKQCSENDDELLRRIAILSGNIPLAMCIAASEIDDFEDSDKFLQYLDEHPYKTLKHPESKHFVYRAINMSYVRLEKEQQEVVVRLATVKGSFSEEAAHAIIEKEKPITQSILQNLAGRNLIKRTPGDRYSVHLLMKLFLRDLIDDNESAESACESAMRAKYLMVKYYLNLGHDLTIQSYSKDAYKSNREALKKEAHNIQNALKICCQQKESTISDIPDCLAHSKIYTTSANYFSLFVRTVIPEHFVDEFLQRCAQLAKEREQHAIKISFDCLLADQERSKTIEEESDESYILKMKGIKEDFNEYNDEFKKDTSVLVHYHYHHGRYLLRKSESLREERLPLQIQAREQFEISLKLRDTAKKPTEKADKIFLFVTLGNIWKKISRSSGKNPKRAIGKAQKYLEDAFHLAEDFLGEHELTSTCLKSFGDLFLTTKKYALAEKKFISAINMRKNLGLQACESHAFLLINLGICFTKTERLEEALDVLGKARDLVEELSGLDESNFCKAKVYANLALTHNSIEPFSKDAIEYAKKAMQFKNIAKVLRFYYEALLKLLLHDVENY